MKKFVTMIIAVAALAVMFTVSASAEDLHYASDTDKRQSEDGTVRSETKYGLFNASASGKVKGKEDQFPGGDNKGDGVMGSANVRVSVIDVDLDVTVGGEDTNFKTGAKASAGTAGASIGGGVTVKDGKVYAGVEAGAEVTAFDIRGKVGGTVGGVDVGIEGGFKVGAGAKAKAGLEDGKLKVELEAALGPGFSAKLEVDVGAIAEKTVGECKNVQETHQATVKESTCYAGVEEMDPDELEAMFANIPPRDDLD